MLIDTDTYIGGMRSTIYGYIGLQTYNRHIRRPRQTQGGARQGIRQASLAAPAARAAAVAVAAAAASPALAVRAAAAANEHQPVASSTQAAAAVNIGLD